MKRLIVIVVVLIVVLNVTGCAQPEDEISTISLVEESLLPATIIEGEPGYDLADRMAHHRVPGVSIAVIGDAEIRWVKHYGVMDVDERRPVSDSTLFNIGSLSKAVTAVTILSLADDGLIDLNASINDQLRSWHLPENEFTRQAAVTPIRLMNHSGGVVFSPPFNYPADSLPTLKQILDGRPPARSAPVGVDCVPGTRFQYSNAGFTVLRQLAEDVTGQPFDEIVNERVFEPIGMSHSSIQAPLPPAMLTDAAMGHRGDGTPDADYRRWLAHTAAGGVWTTAADYAAMVVELQRALQDEPDLVLQQSSVEQMVQPHDAAQYGLGVFQRGGGEEATYVGHLGDGPGFVAGFTMDVVGGRGMVIVTNGQGGISLVREIARSVAKVENWPDIQPEVLVPITLDAQLLKEVAGRYQMGFYEEVVLVLRNGALWLETFEMPSVKLFSVGDETLVCRERTGEIAYERAPDGRIAQITYHLSDELGRLGGEPKLLLRLPPGERTAMGLLLDGETTVATDRFRSLLESDPQSPAASERGLNTLGYQLLGQDRLDDALAVFKLCIELYPESANAHDSRGEALMKTGQIDEAIASYRRSLELDPGNTRARDMIAKMERES